MPACYLAAAPLSHTQNSLPSGSARDDGTCDVYNGTPSKAARKACPTDIAAIARRKLDMIVQAVVLNDLRAPPANRLEKLKGNRAGQHSIRINDQYRICFIWTDAGARDVEIADYH